MPQERCEQTMTIDVRDKLVDAHIHVHSPDFTKYPLAPGFERIRPLVPVHDARRLRSHTPAASERCGRTSSSRRGTASTTPTSSTASPARRTSTSGRASCPPMSDVSLPPPDRAMLRLSERGIRAFRIRGGSARGLFGGKTNWLDYPGYDAMFETAANHGLALSFLVGPRRPAGDRPHVQPLP